MTSSEQSAEVDQNYDVFQRNLATYLADHPGQYALMKHGNVAFYTKPGEAYSAGIARFGEAPFSIQEVTDEPIDLGFFSHVGG